MRKRLMGVLCVMMLMCIVFSACTEAGNSGTENKAAQSVTNISDISKRYDGSKVSAPTYDKLGDGEVTISYYLASDEDGVLLNDAPINEGSYFVRVSVAESDEYLAGYGERAFTISAADSSTPDTPTPDTPTPDTPTPDTPTPDTPTRDAPLIIDYTYAKSADMSSSISLASLSSPDIDEINSKLNIAYFHTSHGAQMIEGATSITAHLLSYYSLANDTIYDNYFEGGGANYKDAGNIRDSWGSSVYATSKDYITAHPETNVVIWAWCGQLCWMSSVQVNLYLTDMAQLESEYPSISFVYMTGHVFNSAYYLSNGSGLFGTEAINTANNKAIRDYCIANNKILFDFESMDMHAPDGSYYGDKHVRDDCTYDSDGDGIFEGNWAREWATKEYNASNITEAERDYYIASGSYHTTNLNNVCKAFAFWNLLHELCAE